MTKYIKKFTLDLENKIKDNYKFSSKEISIIREKINDFQHERLIHLLVTLFYAIFTFIILALSYLNCLFIIPFFILIVFLIFYVRHYFFLENSVQYIYTLYDKIIKNNN